MSAVDDLMNEGYAWYRTLHGTRWRTEAGQVLDLAEMQDAHRANLRGWIDTRAQRIVELAYWGSAKWWGEVFAQPHGEYAEYALERESDAEIDDMLDDPIGWLHATPFYVRLVELLDRDHVDVAMPVRPSSAPRPAPRPVAEV